MSWVGVRATLLFLPYFTPYSCSSLSLLSWNWPSFTGMAGFFCRKPRSMKKSTRGMKISNARTHCRDKQRETGYESHMGCSGWRLWTFILHGWLQLCNSLVEHLKCYKVQLGVVNKDGLLNFGGQCERVSGQLMEKWLALSGEFCMYTEIYTLIELEQSLIVLWFSVAFYLVVANRWSVVKKCLKLPLESISKNMLKTTN